MKPLQLDEILDLVQYEKRRKAIREELIALKARRRLPLNGFLTLLFENRRTAWYQIQEMVRAERMVDEEAIRGELDAYGALVPQGDEWKATLFIEIPDEARLKEMLPRLVGIEQSIYAKVGGRFVPAAGEEGRSREDYTSTVHYLTWSLPPEASKVLARGEALAFGSSHPFCPCEVAAPQVLGEELLKDLED